MDIEDLGKPVKKDIDITKITNAKADVPKGASEGNHSRCVVRSSSVTHSHDCTVRKRNKPEPERESGYKTESSGYSTEADRRKKKKILPTGQSRAKRQPDSQCRKGLEDDEHTDRVEQYRVRCNACHKWITLNQKRPYDKHNWHVHKSKCPQITG